MDVPGGRARWTCQWTCQVDVPGGRARWTCQVDVAVTRARHTGTTMEDALAGLDDEQRAAAMVSRGPVCIIAGAGTGKTRTVTHRLAYGVQTGEVDPGSALAVTHSRKAAAELGERMRVMGVHGVDGRTFHSAASLGRQAVLGPDGAGRTSPQRAR